MASAMMDEVYVVEYESEHGSSKWAAYLTLEEAMVGVDEVYANDATLIEWDCIIKGYPSGRAVSASKLRRALETAWKSEPAPGARSVLREIDLEDENRRLRDVALMIDVEATPADLNASLGAGPVEVQSPEQFETPPPLEPTKPKKKR